MPRLNDTQTVILTNAARREGATTHPLPRSLKADAKAVERTLRGLLKNALVAEGPATGSAVWRETPEGERLALFVTDAGRVAVGMAEGERESEGGRGKAKRQKDGGAAASGKKGGKGAPKERPVTRQDTLIGLLRRPEGATVPKMMEVSGWQAHSVRGFISGTLKAKLGLTVETAVEDGRGRVYRIVEAG